MQWLDTYRPGKEEIILALYEYECACGQRFESIREFAARFVAPPSCGQITSPKPSPVNWSFGWRLTERAHIKGNNPDEYEKDV